MEHLKQNSVSLRTLFIKTFIRRVVYILLNYCSSVTVEITTVRNKFKTRMGKEINVSTFHVSLVIIL
jgi:hypothetical protein